MGRLTTHVLDTANGKPGVEGAAALQAFFAPPASDQ